MSKVDVTFIQPFTDDKCLFLSYSPDLEKPFSSFSVKKDIADFFVSNRELNKVFGARVFSLKKIVSVDIYLDHCLQIELFLVSKKGRRLFASDYIFEIGNSEYLISEHHIVRTIVKKNKEIFKKPNPVNLCKMINAIEEQACRGIGKPPSPIIYGPITN